MADDEQKTPVELFDDKGNKIEGALTGEAAKVLQEKAEKAAELQAEVEKLREKELNFGKFRNKTETEKEEFKKSLSEKEKVLLTELEDLRKERDGEKKARLDRAKESVLAALAGDDADLRKSIEVQSKEFVGEPGTPEELEERYRNAYTLVKGKKPTINPLNQYIPNNGYTAPNTKEKKFVETGKGEEVYKSLFGHAPIKK